MALAAGVPKTTLQVLFKDRETLQARPLEAGVELFTTGMLRSLDPEATPFRRLRTLAEAWFDLVESKELPGGCLITAAANEYRARTGSLRELVITHRGRRREALLEAGLAAEAG